MNHSVTGPPLPAGPSLPVGPPLPAGLPPLPEPLPSPVADGHAHFDLARSGEDPLDVETVLKAAAAVNVTRAVQIGCDLDSARRTLDAVQRYPALLGGVALHPTQASRFSAGSPALHAAFAELEELASHPRIRVIGETGLDHHWVTDPAGRAAAEESFRLHIELAKRTDRVLQIHDRDAHEDVLRVLKDQGAPARTVFHCFSGDAEMARTCVDNGWYLSFAGNITFKNAHSLRAALAEVPLRLLSVETDAPYLTPTPHRGKVNASYLVPHTVRTMAQVLGLDLEAVCAGLDATFEDLYGPW
ncbi:MAG: TatD family hydrolase [Actinomycetota bacterium]|nr:TatD family hydrolase [Actinomycetota bacterium]